MYAKVYTYHESYHEPKKEALKKEGLSAFQTERIELS
jgi:hypothetical protein